MIDLRCDNGIYVLHKSAHHSKLADLYPNLAYNQTISQFVRDIPWDRRAVGGSEEEGEG